MPVENESIVSEKEIKDNLQSDFEQAANPIVKALACDVGALFTWVTREMKILSDRIKTLEQ